MDGAYLEPETSEVLECLRNAEKDPERARRAVFVLAIESRRNVVLCRHLSNPASINALTKLVEDGLETDHLELTSHALRCIGNSSEEADEPHCLLSHNFRWARDCLKHKKFEIRSLTIKVLHNICLEHDKAQRKCYEEGVHFHLMRHAHFVAFDHKVMADGNPGEVQEEFERVVELIFDICGQRPNAKHGLHCPSDWLPHDLFDLCAFRDPIDALKAHPTTDLIKLLFETLLVYLRDTEIQSMLIENDRFTEVWATFTSLEEMIEASSKGLPQAPNPGEEDASAQRLMIALSTSYTWVLSDMASTQLFAHHYNLANPYIQSFFTIFKDHCSGSSDLPKRSRERVLNALCQIMGNFLWGQPPETYGYLALYPEEEPDYPWSGRTETPLIPAIMKMLASADNIDLLHSACGSLRMLARSGVKARKAIGAESDMPVIMEKLCHHIRIEVRQSALKLLKTLGTDCRDNQVRYADQAMYLMTSLAIQDVKSNPGIGDHVS